MRISFCKSSRQSSKTVQATGSELQKHLVKLNSRKVVATAEDNPDTITESNITKTEILDITESDIKVL